jgi:hypothetical protein
MWPRPPSAPEQLHGQATLQASRHCVGHHEGCRSIGDTSPLPPSPAEVTHHRCVRNAAYTAASLTSQPFSKWPSQSANPVLQVEALHVWPLTQEPPSELGGLQFLVQLPQVAGLFRLACSSQP